MSKSEDFTLDMSGDLDMDLDIGDLGDFDLDFEDSGELDINVDDIHSNMNMETDSIPVENSRGTAKPKQSQVKPNRESPKVVQTKVFKKIFK